MNARTYRVGPVDRVRANSWIITGIGPLELPAIEKVRQALTDVAALGPQTRVGLVPTTATRRWRYDDSDMDRRVVSLPAIETDELADVMSAIGADHTGEGLRVYVAGNFLITAASHGLSDARLGLLIQSALISGSTRMWSEQPPARLAVARTILGWFAADPRRVIGVLALPRTRRRGTISWVSPASLPAARPTLRWATMPSNVREQLGAWGDEHAPRATESALLFSAIARALTQTGTPICETTHILVDARRYRPATASFNGNMAVGLEFPFPSPFDPQTLSDRLQAALRAGRPLAAIALSSVKSTLSRHRPTAIAVTDKAVVSFSDVGKAVAPNALPWQRDARRAFIGMVEPFGHNGISFILVRLGDDVVVSCSFNAAAHDSARIDAALMSACRDPLGVLVGSAG